MCEKDEFYHSENIGETAYSSENDYMNSTKSMINDRLQTVFYNLKIISSDFVSYAKECEKKIDALNKTIDNLTAEKDKIENDFDDLNKQYNQVNNALVAFNEEISILKERPSIQKIMTPLARHIALINNLIDKLDNIDCNLIKGEMFCIQNALITSLRTMGIEIVFPEIGTEYNENIYEYAGDIAVKDISSDRHIAKCAQVGYKYNDQIIKPVVFLGKYQIEQYDDAHEQTIDPKTKFSNN